ncbi:hypothetical protein LUX57_46080 [Actinomadura madurae]|nr:hypothetical protein [Actinomadura madurae]MCP9971575.1 hypothetical protein [Actinomadura madurae]
MEACRALAGLPDARRLADADVLVRAQLGNRRRLVPAVLAVALTTVLAVTLTAVLATVLATVLAVALATVLAVALAAVLAVALAAARRGRALLLAAAVLAAVLAAARRGLARLAAVAALTAAARGGCAGLAPALRILRVRARQVGGAGVLAAGRLGRVGGTGRLAGRGGVRLLRRGAGVLLTGRRDQSERRDHRGEGLLLPNHVKSAPFTGGVGQCRARLGTRPVLSSSDMCVLTNFMHRSAYARISLFSVCARTLAMTVKTCP